MLGDDRHRGGCRPARRRCTSRLHSLTGTDPAALAATLESRFCDAVQEEAVPLPSARELLTLLAESGIPAALVSAFSRPVVNAGLKVLDAAGAPAIRTTFAAGETPRTKPSPDPYLAAARALAVDPAACLAVEDSPAGMAAAEAAGCRILAVPSSTPITPAPRRTVRRGLAGIGTEEVWAAGLHTASA
ncbi:HAD family hydrolase [Streptomyces sp. NPDC002520]